MFDSIIGKNTSTIFSKGLLSWFISNSNAETIDFNALKPDIIYRSSPDVILSINYWCKGVTFEFAILAFHPFEYSSYAML